jgi:hypothetical protein
MCDLPSKAGAKEEERVWGTKLEAAINLQKELKCNFTDDVNIDKR